MRPIDADRLKYSISLAMDVVEKTEDDVVVVTIMKIMVKTFLKMIDKSPTLPTPAKQKYDCNHDCDALYEAYQKGREDALKEIKNDLQILFYFAPRLNRHVS